MGDIAAKVFSQFVSSDVAENASAAHSDRGSDILGDITTSDKQPKESGDVEEDKAATDTSSPEQSNESALVGGKTSTDSVNVTHLDKLAKESAGIVGDQTSADGAKVTPDKLEKESADTGAKSSTDSTLPPEYAGHTTLTRLWLQTLIGKNGRPDFRKIRQPRPFNRNNALICIEMLRLIIPRTVASLKQHREIWWRIVLRVVWTMSEGAVPAANIWAADRLVKYVEDALAGNPTSPRNAALAAALVVGLDLFRAVSNPFVRHNNKLIDDYIEFHTGLAWLAFKQSKSNHIGDPVYKALLFEGKDFVKGRYDRKKCKCIGGSMVIPESFSVVLKTLVTMVSQLALVATVLRGHGSRSKSTAALIILALIPPLTSLIESARPNPNRMTDRELRRVCNAQWGVTQAYNNATSSAYEQEMLLFGLGNWMVQKWSQRKQMLYSVDPGRMFKLNFESLGFQTVYNSVPDLISFLLASGIIHTHLPRRKVFTLSSAARTLVHGMRNIRNALGETWEGIFDYVSYLALNDYATTTSGGLDYEKNRKEGGMRIEARGLCYKYPKAKKLTLTGIDLTVEAGETLAIVGSNGSGKTTLLKVLLGLDSLESGELLINNVAATEYDLRTLRARISCLFQGFNKYTMTVAENIGIGAVSRVNDMDQITRAAKQGGAAGIVEEHGLNMNLCPYLSPKDDEPDSDSDSDSDHGGDGDSEPDSDSDSDAGSDAGSDAKDDSEKEVGLSVGQWQRIALARAFMRCDTADLVVFDEPSSALDPVAEAALFNDIHALSERDGHKITTIFVSHRMCTVDRADKIAFVDKGAIAEYGTLQELLALKGKFYEFYTLQVKGIKNDVATEAKSSKVKSSTSKAKSKEAKAADKSDSVKSTDESKTDKSKTDDAKLGDAKSTDETNTNEAKSTEEARSAYASITDYAKSTDVTRSVADEATSTDVTNLTADEAKSTEDEDLITFTDELDDQRPHPNGGLEVGERRKNEDPPS